MAMARAQHDLITVASEVEDSEPSMPSAGQRKRMVPIISALCVACLLAASGLAGHRTRPHLRLGGGRVGLAATTISDDDAVWDSVSGAAMIEQMQEQLDGAKGEAKAALQEKLAKLKQDTPGWEEITSTYGSTDAWDDIKNSAKLEQLQQAVKDAKASGSDKLGGLQEELEKAQAAVPSVDDVKQQASALWQDKADKLPDLDDIRANAHKLREDMQDSVSAMVDNAWGSVKKWF
jgi:hypothetical protein